MSQTCQVLTHAAQQDAMTDSSGTTIVAICTLQIPYLFGLAWASVPT
jgi:hypothetical protein